MNRKEAIFFVLLALQNLAFNFAHPVTPSLIINLHLNSSIFGIAFAAMALTSFLFSQLWGVLSSYKNDCLIFMLGCLGYACSQYFFLISTSEMSIIVARLLGGIFIAAINVSSLNYLVRISSIENRGRNITFFATITLVCTSFGYLFGGFIGDLGIQYAFLSQIITLITCGLLFYFLCDKKQSQPLNHNEFISKSNPFLFIKDRNTLTKTLLFSMFLAFATTIAQTTYEQSFNYYMKDFFNFPPSLNGIVKAGVGLVSLFSISVICLWIQRKNIIKKSLSPIFLLCSFLLFLSIQFKKIDLFIIFSLIFSSVNALYLPLIQDLVTSAKSTINTLGLYNSMKSLGWIFGGLLAGLLYAISNTLPFITACLIFILCAILCIAKFKPTSSK